MFRCGLSADTLRNSQNLIILRRLQVIKVLLHSRNYRIEILVKEKDERPRDREYDLVALAVCTMIKPIGPNGKMEKM